MSLLLNRPVKYGDDVFQGVCEDCQDCGGTRRTIWQVTRHSLFGISTIAVNLLTKFLYYLFISGQLIAIVKEFKTVSEILAQSHQTVGRLYEENGAMKLSRLSQSLAAELKRVKSEVAKQNAALMKERNAAQGTTMSMQFEQD